MASNFFQKKNLRMAQVDSVVECYLEKFLKNFPKKDELKKISNKILNGRHTSATAKLSVM